MLQIASKIAGGGFANQSENLQKLLDKKTIAVQKLRDIFKNDSIKYTGKSYVVLIGVENQSDIHYSIPVKNMFYDVMAYGNQVKETAKKHRKEKDTAL